VLSLGIILVLLVYVQSMFVVVPAGHVAAVRNSWTQASRLISAGFNFLRPFENIIEACMPDGAVQVRRRFFAPGGQYRFDPEPYEALTEDQIPVDVDLYAYYSLSEDNTQMLLKMYDGTDFKPFLDDTLRSRTQSVVANYKRKALNAATLATALNATGWPSKLFQIVRAGIQGIQFDDRTELIQRAESMGVPAEEIMRHISHSDFNEAIRSAPNATLMVGGDPRQPSKVYPIRGGTARQRRAGATTTSY